MVISISQDTSAVGLLVYGYINSTGYICCRTISLWLYYMPSNQCYVTEMFFFKDILMLEIYISLKNTIYFKKYLRHM